MLFVDSPNTAGVVKMVSFCSSRCSSCQVVFGGLNSIKSHIQTAHCEVFHKCPSCPMAFKSSPSAQNHISTQHPTLTGGQAKYVPLLHPSKGFLYLNFKRTKWLSSLFTG